MSGDSDNPHSFMWEYDHWMNCPVIMVQDIREQLDRLPETATTFNPVEAVDGTADAKQKGFFDKMMALVGSWRLPDIYGGASHRERWVNPHSPTPYKYPDVFAVCECGNIFTHPQPRQADVDGSGETLNQHEEGECLPYHRMEMKADLMRQREKCIRQMHLFGSAGKPLTSRLGLKSESVSHIRERFGLVASELREEYRQYRDEAFRELFKCGWNSREIAEVYGYSRSYVTKAVRERYGVSAKKFKP